MKLQPRGAAGGEIDGACPGKNGWDDAIRGLVPRILDIRIEDWEAQKMEAVQKLRDRLNSEFEYLDNPLSMQGFRNTVKRYLKVREVKTEDEVPIGRYS
jgi:hypothetical protein